MTGQEAMADDAVVGREVVEVAEGEQLVIPLVAESLVVSKEKVVTGGVRVSTKVVERTETADVPLRRETVEVERIVINRQVTEAPQPRQEGDTLVIPIMEEVLVVEKRLFLKEEVRVRRTVAETHSPQTVTLRSEEVVIENIALENIAPEDAPLSR